MNSELRSFPNGLKEINPEYALEALMLNLKLQYFGHLMRRADSLEKTLIFCKTDGRRRGLQRMRWLDGIIDSMDMSEQTPEDSEGRGSLLCCSPWSDRVTKQQYPGHRCLPHTCIHVQLCLLLRQLLVCRRRSGSNRLLPPLPCPWS